MLSRSGPQFQFFLEYLVHINAALLIKILLVCDAGKPCNQAIHGPSSSSSLSTHPVSDQTLRPEVTSYIEELENLLLGEPDTSTGKLGLVSYISRGT